MPITCFRIRKDGSGRERVTDTPILNKTIVSPDGDWAIVNRAMTGEGASQESSGELTETVAISLRGGAPRRICAFNCLPAIAWSPDGRLFQLSPEPEPDGGSPRDAWPDVPGSAGDRNRVPGRRGDTARRASDRALAGDRERQSLDLFLSEDRNPPQTFSEYTCVSAIPFTS
jgi:hypothetical protein